MDGKVFTGREEIDEYIRNMTPDQSHALYMKTFTTVLKAIGLRSPQYYEDKSQCMSFADIRPAERACFKASNLKSGYIEPKDLIKRLRQLKPSDNFELREYEHPYMGWKKSPFAYKETPFDFLEDPPHWLLDQTYKAFRVLGDSQGRLFADSLEERWHKLELSIDRTPLPDLHLLKNMGSSPHGTLYPRDFVNGLYTLCDRAHEKVEIIYDENATKADEKREATILSWKERHPDVELSYHPVSIFRTWPSDLMDELDEIDREMVRCGRSSYIALLEEAEKQMQELLKFWKECGLITGKRTPPSPDMPLPDRLPEDSSQIGRGEHPSPGSGSLSSPPAQDDSSQLQAKLPGPAHKPKTKTSLSGHRNVWDGRLRSRIKTAKTIRQTSQRSRPKSVHKPSGTERRNIWDGRLRSSTKKVKAIG